MGRSNFLINSRPEAEATNSTSSEETQGWVRAFAFLEDPHQSKVLKAAQSTWEALESPLLETWSQWPCHIDLLTMQFLQSPRVVFPWIVRVSHPPICTAKRQCEQQPVCETDHGLVRVFTRQKDSDIRKFSRRIHVFLLPVISFT